MSTESFTVLFSPLSVALALAGLVIAYQILLPLLDPCRSVPGPFIARFTKLWNISRVARGDYEVTATELHRKYGPVVRVQPGQYITSDVAAAKTMFQVTGPTFKKDKWHDVWTPPPPGQPGLFADRDPKRHAAQRKKVSAMYSMSSIVGYEPFVDDSITILKARLSKAARLNQTVELAELLQCYAFDVISSITFGERFGTLDENKEPNDLFTSIDQRTIYGTFAGFYPWIHPWLYPEVVKRTRSKFVFSFCFNRIATIKEALRTGRETSCIKALPFIARLINKHLEDPEKVTDADITSTALSNVFAGSDTTATSLSGVLYHIIRNPQVLAKLRSEIDTAIAGGRASSPISFTQAESLPYLQACIKEGMRLHRAGALPLNREVPPTGMNVQGHFLPSGSVIGINGWALHRNKQVYGEDADLFRPERWIEFAQIEGKLAEVEASYLTFGRGSRSCIGRNIAMIEIEKVVPELISSFDFEIPDWTAIEKDGGGLITRGWQFAKVISFKARIKERKKALSA